MLISHTSKSFIYYYCMLHNIYDINVNNNNNINSNVNKYQLFVN